MSVSIPSPRTAPPRRRRLGYSGGTAPLTPQLPTLPGAATPTAGTVSPFERSETSTTIQRTNETLVPVAGDHDTHDRGGRYDDDWMCDDGSFDSKNAGLLNSEEVRKSSWFRDFLTRLGEMNPEEVTDPAAKVRCPACKGGREEALFYRGFQQLLDHARSITEKRVWLHQRFTEVLEKELKNYWQGLGWPPVAVDLNTRLGKQGVSYEWAGMENGGLLDCLRHGDCGANSSVLGYHPAERSYNQGSGRRHKENLWKQQATEKQLPCGYMATEEEKLDIFSTHYGDKQKLKYEMKLHQMTCGSIHKLALLEREIEKEIEQKNNLARNLHQRDLEIKATMRMLTEQSAEHYKEIESLNEHCKKLCNKLSESEMAQLKTQKQLVLLHVLVVMIMVNLMNTGDGHDSMENK